ncbi:MAG: hypothetical protein AAF202_07900, partial [Pseudomonadota bacterium]
DAIQPVGIDALLMDPRSEGSGHRSFLEANLFTYESNGFRSIENVNNPLDALVSFTEGVHFLTYLYSAAQLSNRVYDELKNRVPVSAEDDLDIKGLQFVHRRESALNMASVLLQKIDTMPGLTEFIASADGEQRQELVESLFSAAKSVHSRQEWVEKSELDVAVAVLQYSESIMTRFNSDGDEFLSEGEVEAAYPVFEEFLRDMVKKMCVEIPSYIGEDWFLLHIFREIVTTGQIPEADMSRWGEIWMIVKFVKRDVLWSVELNRLDVIKIFSSVVAKSAEAAASRGENQSCSSVQAVEPSGASRAH